MQWILRYYSIWKCKECWALWKGSNEAPTALNPYPPGSIPKSWASYENFPVTSRTHTLYRIGEKTSSPGRKALATVLVNLDSILCCRGLSLHTLKVTKEISTPYLALLRTFVLHLDLTTIIGKKALQIGNQVFPIYLRENES